MADDLLTGFELIPFVFIADEQSISTLRISTDLPDIEEIRISADQIGPHFGNTIITLRDDGVYPDEIADDHTFSASIQLISLPDSYPASNAVREVLVELLQADGSVFQFLEDVGFSYGILESRRAVQVISLDHGISFTSRVVNVVDPNLVFRAYPDGLILQTDSSVLLYDELFDDRYDWLVFFHVLNRRGAPGGSFATVRNQVEGIGKPLSDSGAEWGSAARLKGVINLNWKHVEVLSHEIFHTWGVYGFDVFGMQSSLLGLHHWGAFAHSCGSSIFGGLYTQSSLWDNFDGSFSGCRSTDQFALPIELYLMGLVPASSIEEYEFVISSEVLGWDFLDPYCAPSSRIDFLGNGLTTLNESAILNAFGPRIPSYPDQNEFNAAPVVVSGRPLTTEEWSYIDYLFELHPSTFFADYQEMAAITYKLTIAPDVATLPATEVSDSTATLNATLDPRGLLTQVKFQFREGDDWEDELLVDGEFTGTSTINISAELSGLTPETTYYFRSVATNTDISTAGVNYSFTTDSPQDSDSDGVPDHIDRCPQTEIPEDVPTQNLGRNRWALVDGDTIFDTLPFANKPIKNPYTTEDTFGCSCDQIVREMNASRINIRLGCATKLMEDWIAVLAQ